MPENLDGEMSEEIEQVSEEIEQVTEEIADIEEQELSEWQKLQNLQTLQHQQTMERLNQLETLIVPPFQPTSEMLETPITEASIMKEVPVMTEVSNLSTNNPLSVDVDDREKTQTRKQVRQHRKQAKKAK